MAERGFDAAPIAPAIEAIEHDDYRGRTPPAQAQARRWPSFGARAPHEVDDLRAAIEAERPDALLVDCMCWGAAAVAEQWGGPWAQWFPYPLPLSSRDAPPFGPGLKPARGPLGRLRDRALRPVLVRTMAGATLPAGQRDAPRGRRARVQRPRRPVHRAAAAALHDRRAARVPALGLAGVGARDRPVRLGPAGRGARVARRDRPPARDRDHVVRVPGRRAPRGHRARGAPGRGRLRRRHAALGRAPGRRPGQRARGDLRAARARCSRARRARSPTAAPAPRRRRWPPACRSASSRSAATSSRSRAASSSPAPARACPLARLKADRLRTGVRDAMAMRDGARRVAEGFAAAGGAVAGADAFEALTTAAGAPRRRRRPRVLSGRNGGGGIRTRGPRERTPVFKTGAFDRSATPPRRRPYAHGAQEMRYSWRTHLDCSPRSERTPT